MTQNNVCALLATASEFLVSPTKLQAVMAVPHSIWRITVVWSLSDRWANHYLFLALYTLSVWWHCTLKVSKHF